MYIVRKYNTTRRAIVSHYQRRFIGRSGLQSSVSTNANELQPGPSRDSNMMESHTFEAYDNDTAA
jgi:hypothetical protein